MAKFGICVAVTGSVVVATLCGVGVLCIYGIVLYVQLLFDLIVVVLVSVVVVSVDVTNFVFAPDWRKLVEM